MLTINTTHVLNAKGIQDVDFFKNTIAIAASKVADLMPEGREKSLFLTKIEEASFYGTRALSTVNGNYNEVVNYPINNA